MSTVRRLSLLCLLVLLIDCFAVFADGAGGRNLFAEAMETGNGMVLSTDNGTNWTEVNTGLTNTYVFSLAVSGTNLFAGTYGSGVFLSTNNGTSWTAAGLPNTSVLSLAVSDTNLFAGTAQGHGGVWRRPLSEITSVSEILAEIPRNFALQQNYPNPFNPSTVILFQVPSSSLVGLKVYNILGQEVATLVNEELKAGRYEIKWDAEGLASGMYFCRLHAGEFTETRKLLLLR